MQKSLQTLFYVNTSLPNPPPLTKLPKEKNAFISVVSVRSETGENSIPSPAKRRCKVGNAPWMFFPLYLSAQWICELIMGSTFCWLYTMFWLLICVLLLFYLYNKEYIETYIIFMGLLFFRTKKLGKRSSSVFGYQFLGFLKLFECIYYIFLSKYWRPFFFFICLGWGRRKLFWDDWWFILAMISIMAM